MTKPISTYKILMQKAFNQDIDESWIDWAIEMMEAGYESDNLYILAGETKPYNQFEMQLLNDKVLQDLHLSFSNKVKIIKEYVYFLVTNAIDNSNTYIKTLRELKDICIDRDMDNKYMNFYLLYFAKEDLIESEDQWYWDGANRNNIDFIIKNEFQKFIDDFDNEEKQMTA